MCPARAYVLCLPALLCLSCVCKDVCSIPWVTMCITQGESVSTGTAYIVCSEGSWVLSVDVKGLLCVVCCVLVKGHELRLWVMSVFCGLCVNAMSVGDCVSNVSEE